MQLSIVHVNEMCRKYEQFPQVTKKLWYYYTKKSDIRLTPHPPNYSIWIFTHLKLCLADAIHNFKWVKIIQIWQNGGQLFSNNAGWCHILSLTYGT